MKMLLTVLVLFFSYSAFSEDQKICPLHEPQVDTRPVEIQLKEANALLDNSMKYKKAVDWFNAPAKTKAQLQALASVESPLDALPQGAKQKFIDRVVWRENGIAGYRYVDLQQLTPTQIYEILSLIGAQYMVGRFKEATVVTELDAMLMGDPNYLRSEDYDGYWCKSRATCSISHSDICTGGC